MNKTNISLASKIEDTNTIPYTAESLISQAINKNVAVETLERLLAMRLAIKHERAEEEFNLAMCEFQAECPVIKKDKVVRDKHGKFRYRYAPLDVIILQIKDIIAKHGFSYSTQLVIEEQWVTAVCTVTHVSGHSKSSEFKVIVDKDAYMTEPQKFASASTFAKRYAFCNAFGILTGDEDNDANVIEVDNSTTKPPVTKVKEIKSTPTAPVSVIDIYKDKIGGKGRYADRAWIDAPIAYLKSLLDPKYSVNISDAKLDAIKRTIEYLEESKNKEITESKPLFDDEGVIIETNITEPVAVNEEKDKETVILTSIKDTEKSELLIKDPNRDKDPASKDIIDFADFILKTTVLFTRIEKERILAGINKLTFNLAIAQIEQLIKVYKQRYDSKYRNT